MVQYLRRFFNNKNFFWATWRTNFCQNVFYILIYTWLSTLILRLLSLLSTLWSIYTLLCLACGLILWYFLKTMSNCKAFFTFQRNSPCIFAIISTCIISITHNTNRNVLLHLLINCISANSAPQMLFLKEAFTSWFLHFPINDLCNSLGYCWLSK